MIWWGSGREVGVNTARVIRREQSAEVYITFQRGGNEKQNICIMFEILFQH